MAAPRGRAVTLTRRGWSLLGGAFGLVVGSYLLGTVEMRVLGIAALVLLGGLTLWLTVTRGSDGCVPTGSTSAP